MQGLSHFYEIDWFDVRVPTKFKIVLPGLHLKHIGPAPWDNVLITRMRMLAEAEEYRILQE